jgi:hypothetical protein
MGSDPCFPVRQRDVWKREQALRYRDWSPCKESCRSSEQQFQAL